MDQSPPSERPISTNRAESYNSEVISIIETELDQLKTWAKNNELDARKDKRNFWALKIPAIVGGLSISALDYFGYGSAVIVVGLITSICVAIDGVHPRGSLYNVHKKAANELYGLQDKLGSQLDQLRIKHHDLDNEQCRTDASLLLMNIQKEKDRINKYITSVEAGLDLRLHEDVG